MAAPQPGRPGLRAHPALGALRLALLLLLAVPLAAGDPCPCQDAALCRPIQQRRDSEVFVFHVGQKTWKSYDWSLITTVAVFGNYDSELMCYAHSQGARVVLTGDVSLKDIIDPTFRASWIAQKVKLAKTQYMDGINLDIEQRVKCFSPEYDALTALVKEITESFHHEIEGSQVTFDVAWSPNHTRRCYNYTGIAGACDFLFVMSYDVLTGVWSDCIASANSPYNKILTGYDNYIKMGIDPKKLVMGIPWYGFDFTCLNLSKDDVCTLAKIPFRGSPCNATMHQVTYKIIMKQVNSSISGNQWDKDQQSPYYNYKDPAGHFHQVWYDNPHSISLKAAYVQYRGLRGIGMWHANCLDYSGNATAKQQTEEMWKALKPKL
ncbi:di-N-acetylchitobiase [Manis pentadactyla]|uniref:di-N-acetylchitobiase n=1 Tax=Manis pentadactyla TaxID=143292 RepID=UPI00255CF275|nr:di-N-acetylchitobiase [Manis pentadactyla]KAI5243659.1 Di-N-Acetylchitobiase [Manis pentadactyla]